MIFDMNDALLPLARMHFDVCIAGAGVAGIAIALKLASAGRRVAVFEAGGMSPSPASQEFYRGEIAGAQNLPLDETRIRALGGSSNHWGGWCRPLDPYDFERSDYSPDGAWPIGAADIRPYLQVASAFLDVSSATGADLPLEGGDGNIGTIGMKFSAPPAAVGLRYRGPIEVNPGLYLFVNAVVSTANFDLASGRLISLGIIRKGSTDLIECRARQFVLAMGAVENARRLLIWNRTYQDRLGNQEKLVGRYYLQHLHQEAGHFVRFAPDGSQNRMKSTDRTFFAGTAPFLREKGIGAFRLYSKGIACSPLSDELRDIAAAVACTDIASAAALFITAEHHPNFDSCIQLADEVDDLGDPRVLLDLQLGETDAVTLREASVEFGRYLIRAGIGRLKVNPHVLAGRDPVAGWTKLPSALGAAGHQMGGARMSGSPSDGVVDKNCKVWSVENLYVAGSAVFRTCGHATPTLTIVQLAYRLADRLMQVLSAE